MRRLQQRDGLRAVLNSWDAAGGSNRPRAAETPRGDERRGEAWPHLSRRSQPTQIFPERRCLRVGAVPSAIA